MNEIIIFNKNILIIADFVFKENIPKAIKFVNGIFIIEIFILFSIIVL